MRDGGPSSPVQDSSMTTAAAVSLPWVSETWVRVAPSTSMRAAALPCKTSCGAPAGATPTSMSRGPIPSLNPVPRAFTAFLDGEASGKEGNRVRRGHAHHFMRMQDPSGEPVSEAAPALGYTVDFGDVDAYADDHPFAITRGSG